MGWREIMNKRFTEKNIPSDILTADAARLQTEMNYRLLMEGFPGERILWVEKVAVFGAGPSDSAGRGGQAGTGHRNKSGGGWLRRLLRRIGRMLRAHRAVEPTSAE